MLDKWKNVVGYMYGIRKRWDPDESKPLQAAPARRSLVSFARASVSFRSGAFNTVRSDKYFIVARSYGDDLANWLMHELVRRNAELDVKIGQKRASWYVEFNSGGKRYEFEVRYRAPDWIGRLRRRPGLLRRVFGTPDTRIQADAVLLIHSVLSVPGLIEDIRWQYN